MAAPWRDLFTGRPVKPDPAGVLPVSVVLADFPCAVLTRGD